MPLPFPPPPPPWSSSRVARSFLHPAVVPAASADDEEEEDDDEDLGRAKRLKSEEQAFVKGGMSKEERQAKRQEEKQRRLAAAAGPARDEDGDRDPWGKKRGRGKGKDDALAVYDAAKEGAEKRKQAREDIKLAREREAAEKAGNASSEEEVDGERRASKSILKNRGLMKYRNKDRKNPRKNQRLKYESAVKRRKGQVLPVRVGEADMYAGEVTGIRKNVSRSHKIA